VLAAEKILPKDTRQQGDKTSGHEGELTAAKRLVDKLSYGPRFVDVFTTRVKDERTTLYQEILI